MSLIITKEFVNECKRIGYLKYVACQAVEQLEEKDKQIAELKAENRKLKRALYKSCANWADAVAFEETEGIGYDNSVAERWRKMESKCLKKAEEYK